MTDCGWIGTRVCWTISLLSEDTLGLGVGFCCCFLSLIFKSLFVCVFMGWIFTPFLVLVSPAFLWVWVDVCFLY